MKEDRPPGYGIGNGMPVCPAICRKVPAKPAETLQEALAAIWICYHLLLQENTNFGFSIGRLDQLVNRYYLADWEKLGDDEAREAYVARAVERLEHRNRMVTLEQQCDEVVSRPDRPRRPCRHSAR